MHERTWTSSDGSAAAGRSGSGCCRPLRIWSLCTLLWAYSCSALPAPERHLRYPESRIIHDEGGLFRWQRDEARKGRQAHMFDSWMEDNKDMLRAQSLTTVTLPGSHDSATFALTNEVMPGSLAWPEDDIVQLAADAGLPAAEYIIHWSIAQKHSVRAQLERGIRFLDLRAGFNGSTWAVCHTLTGVPLDGVLRDVASFLRTHPKEVVVVELVHVYNSSISSMRILQDMLASILGPWLDSDCRLELTFAQRWKRDARLVLVTSVPPAADMTWCPPHTLWNSWADSDDLQVMWDFNQDIVEHFPDDKSQLFKLSWTLTPQLSTLAVGLLEEPSTLIALATVGNPLFPDFIDAIVREDHHAYPQIMLADDFEGAALVPMVLHLNSRHAVSADERGVRDAGAFV